MPRANKINDGRSNTKIEDPYKALAMAIITRAVYDLQQGTFTLLAGADQEAEAPHKRRRETMYKAKKYRDEAISFFSSGWYKLLTEILDLDYDGRWMISHSIKTGERYYQEWQDLKTRNARDRYWSSHKVKY